MLLYYNTILSCKTTNKSRVLELSLLVPRSHAYARTVAQTHTREGHGCRRGRLREAKKRRNMQKFSSNAWRIFALVGLSHSLSPGGGNGGNKTAVTRTTRSGTEQKPLCSKVNPPQVYAPCRGHKDVPRREVEPEARHLPPRSGEKVKRIDRKLSLMIPFLSGILPLFLLNFHLINVSHLILGVFCLSLIRISTNLDFKLFNYSMCTIYRDNSKF